MLEDSNQRSQQFPPELQGWTMFSICSCGEWLRRVMLFMQVPFFLASWVKMLHYYKNGSISLETWLWYVCFCSSKTVSEFSFKLNLTLSSGYKSITIDLLADSLFWLNQGKVQLSGFGDGGACSILSSQSWNVVEVLVWVKSAAELNSFLLGKLLSPLEG